MIKLNSKRCIFLVSIFTVLLFFPALAQESTISVYYFSTNIKSDSGSLSSELIEVLCQEKCFKPNDMRIYHYGNTDDEEYSSIIPLSRLSKKARCVYLSKNIGKILSGAGCETSIEREIADIKENKQRVLKNLTVKLIWASDKPAPIYDNVEVIKSGSDLIDVHDHVAVVLSKKDSNPILLLIYREANQSGQKPVVEFPVNSYSVNFGDSVQLSPLIRGGFKSIEWSPNTFLSCSDCQQPWAAPDESMEYSVKVANHLGCVSDVRKINVFVSNSCIFQPKSLKLHISSHVNVFDSTNQKNTLLENKTCSKDDVKGKDCWTINDYNGNLIWYLIADNNCAQYYDLEIWSIDRNGKLISKLLNKSFGPADFSSATPFNKLYPDKMVFVITPTSLDELKVFAPGIYDNDYDHTKCENNYYKIKLISYKRRSDREKGIAWDSVVTPEVLFKVCK